MKKTARVSLRLIPMASALLLLGCGEPDAVHNGGWRHDELGQLTYRNSALPECLVTNQVGLVTPLGEFVPNSDGSWAHISYRIPLPDPEEPWVQITITSTAISDDMKQRGFYRVDELAIGSGTWRDTQLGGTPPQWIYAFKTHEEEERGYWISPSRLSDIDWSSL